MPGIEPRTYAWKAYVLPLNYMCFNIITTQLYQSVVITYNE